MSTHPRDDRSPTTGGRARSDGSRSMWTFPPHPTDDRAWTTVTASPRGARVLTPRATFDAAAAAQLRREVRALLARSAAPLVVDLSAVRDVEPAAASGALRDVAYEAGDADVDLRVVRGPVALLDDEELFELYPTLDAALGHRARDSGPTPA